MYIMMIEVLGNDLFLFTVTTSRIPSAYRIPTIRMSWFCWFLGWNLEFGRTHFCIHVITVRKPEQWNDWLVGVPVWRRIPHSTSFLDPRSTQFGCDVYPHTSEKWRHEVRSPCVDTRLATSNRIWGGIFISNFVDVVCIWFVSRIYTTQNIHTHTCITPNQRVTYNIYIYIYIYIDRLKKRIHTYILL